MKMSLIFKMLSIIMGMRRNYYCYYYLYTLCFFIMTTPVLVVLWEDFVLQTLTNVMEIWESFCPQGLSKVLSPHLHWTSRNSKVHQGHIKKKENYTWKFVKTLRKTMEKARNFAIAGKWEPCNKSIDLGRYTVNRLCVHYFIEEYVQ